MKPRAVYVDLGFLLANVAYVPTRKVWDAEVKRLDLGGSVYPHDRDGFTSDAYCTHWTSDDAYPTILITLADKVDRLPMTRVFALITHECMHAWRYIRQHIGEAEPSLEFEAYAMQRLVQDIVEAHQKYRKHPWKSPE